MSKGNTIPRQPPTRHKRKAELDEKLMKMDARRRHSHRLERLTTKRTRRINHYLHTESHRIVKLLV